MDEFEKNINRIREILQYDQKFLAYQELPPFIHKFKEINEIKYHCRQLPWDKPRYDWIDTVLPTTVSSAVEVGSSLGYFSLMLAHDRGMHVTGYEPVSQYAELSNIFAQLSRLGNQTNFHGQGILLSDIQHLPKAELFISLNVLHHAGNFYDKDTVSTFENWMQYAQNYLIKISQQFPYLIFQCGNSAPGTTHFEGKETLISLIELLKASNYSVKDIGIIEDPDNIVYSNYNEHNLRYAPRIFCQRNSKTNLVDYFKNEIYIGSYKYGTLQRPIFFCQRK